jgi:hypothetical protein
MCTLAFSRTTPATLSDDFMEMSFHWAVEAGPGVPAAPLTGTQAASIEGLLDTWFTAIKPWIFNTIQLREYQWRDFSADFPRGESGLLKYSPTWRTTPKGVFGSIAAGSELPHQVASTFTETTCSRQHWGRAYLPGLGHIVLTSYGRFTTTFVDSLANTTRALFNSAIALPAITNPWVWSPRYAGLLSVRELHVDDIPDVQRRRRDKQVSYRKSLTS